MMLNQLCSWLSFLEAEFQKTYFLQLQGMVEAAYAAEVPPVYPSQEDIFRAFKLTPPESIRCVILGQDPYPGQGQAHGLAFSVKPGVGVPKSLKNIFRELYDDIGVKIPEDGCLEGWAREGVLLLNTVLTVYEGQPYSHRKWGWEKFTQAVLERTRELPQPIVFVLWGAKAQAAAEAAKVAESVYPRLCLSSAHPSPLGAYRGFWGSRPFSKANDFLVANGVEPVDWALVPEAIMGNE